MQRELPSTRWLTLTALGWASLVLAIGLVLVAQDGVKSGALFWTLPPLIVAWGGALALTMAPVSGLLFVAILTELTAPRWAPSGSSVGRSSA